MEARRDFIEDIRRGGLSFSEVCRRHGISRRTGYKWKKRVELRGEELGVLEESRRPHCSPNQTRKEVEQAVVAVRQEHPVWGGRKIRRVLLNEGMSADEVPAASTITGILRRHGLLGEGMRMGSDKIKRFERKRPNDLWQMDFKGWFETANEGRCYPLTILDDHSRYNLVIEACASEQGTVVQPILGRTFERYGLPRQILCDHGSPWGKVAEAETGRRVEATRLEAWLMRLGVELIHGRVGHPQTQGKEERFHRTLKAEVLSRREVWLDLPTCQKSFDVWRKIYNHKRPHESLDDDVPSSRYELSERSYQGEEHTSCHWYLEDDLIRTVRSKGEMTFRNRTFYAGSGYAGQKVALRGEGDQKWGVYYCWKRIGEVDFTKALKPKYRYNPIRDFAK